MRKTAVRYGLALLGAYIVFLVVQFPAVRLYAWLEAETDLPVQLYRINGSVWHGTAGAATLRDVRLDRLAWRLRPTALITGRVEAALELTRDGGYIETVAGRAMNGALYLRDMRASFPLDELAPLVTGARMGLTGSLDVRLERLEVAPGRIVAARGTISIADAGVGPPIDASLGGFSMTFRTTDEGIKGVLKDDGGPLQADGVLVLQPDGGYRLTAVLAARDPGRSDLRQALRLVGTPSPAGKVSLRRSGNIPLERYLPL